MIEETGLAGVKLLKPQVFIDDRGYFVEVFHKERLKVHGITNEFVQDNEAMSHKGVLRGLHYQCGAAAQHKLVRVVKGAVFDVAVDIRPDSPTYGQWYGTLLSGENKHQLFIPGYCAHGYIALADETIFAYKCSQLYSPQDEGGIHPKDETLNIDWPSLDIPELISERDLGLPTFGEHKRV